MGQIHIRRIVITSDRARILSPQALPVEEVLVGGGELANICVIVPGYLVQCQPRKKRTKYFASFGVITFLVPLGSRSLSPTYLEAVDQLNAEAGVCEVIGSHR